MDMEIRPAEGGDDASLFADEFARAVAKHSGAQVATDGTTRILHRL